MMSAPVACTSSGRIAFTVAAVPTGMKAGVRILPRCIVIAPVRALPSVAEMEKENLGEAISALLISVRSEEHTSELQSLMRISYAVFCLTKKITQYNNLY